MGVTVRKVVVTGMGCVSGLGANKTTTWDNLVVGKSAIRPVSVCPEGQRELSFAGVAAPAVEDALHNLAARYEDKQLNVDMFSNFDAAATLEALEDAGIWGDEAQLSDAAIIYGNASGGNAAMEAGYLRLFFFAACQCSSHDHPSSDDQCCGVSFVDAFRDPRTLPRSFERVRVIGARDRRGYAFHSVGSFLHCDHGWERCQPHIRLASRVEGAASDGARHVQALLHRSQGHGLGRRRRDVGLGR